MTFNQFFNKYKRVILLVSIVVVTIFIFNRISNTQKNVRNKVEDYIKFQGFKLDSDKILYKKDIQSKKEVYEVDKKNNVNTSYETMYFNIYSYDLIDNLSVYNKGVETVFIGTKDFSKDMIIYSYNTYYKNSNVIFSGEYTSDSFTCNLGYEYSSIVKNKEEYCSIIKKYVENFDKNTKKTFRSMKIINYMKNNKED